MAIYKSGGLKRCNVRLDVVIGGIGLVSQQWGSFLGAIEFNHFVYIHMQSRIF